MRTREIARKSTGGRAARASLVSAEARRELAFRWGGMSTALELSDNETDGESGDEDENRGARRTTLLGFPSLDSAHLGFKSPNRTNKGIRQAVTPEAVAEESGVGLSSETVMDVDRSTMDSLKASLAWGKPGFKFEDEEYICIFRDPHGTCLVSWSRPGTLRCAALRCVQLRSLAF